MNARPKHSRRVNNYNNVRLKSKKPAKHKRKEIRFTRKVIQQVIDLLPVMVFAKDAQGRFLYANKAVADSLGLSINDITGSHHLNVHKNKEEAEVMLADDQDVINKGHSVLIPEVKYHDSVGNLKYLQTIKTPYKPIQSDLPAVIGISVDITAQKKAVDELKTSKKYMETLINSLPSIVIGVDQNLVISSMNTMALELVGKNLEECIGKPFIDIFKMFEEYVPSIVRSIKSDDVIHDENIQIVSKCMTCYYDMHISPFNAEDIHGAVIRIDDVTQKVKVQEVMCQNEKMKLVNGLAAGVTHEINNPLAIIAQGIQNLKRRISPQFTQNYDDAREAGIHLDSLQNYIKKRRIDDFIKDINDASFRASEILRKMPDFTSEVTDKFKYESISTLLDEVLEMATHEYRLRKKLGFSSIKLIKEYSDKLPKIYCIKSEIEQVLLQILKNGAEVMRATLNPPTPFGKGATSKAPLAKGKMSQRDRGDYIPKFIIKAYEQNKSLYIEIEDNGPGMSEDIRKQVFDPFFTTKEVGKGIGLGLSVAYYIISHNHKGRMWVESKEGYGAKFVIELPVN